MTHNADYSKSTSMADNTHDKGFYTNFEVVWSKHCFVRFPFSCLLTITKSRLKEPR
jgi:hypothetical protein